MPHTYRMRSNELSAPIGTDTIHYYRDGQESRSRALQSINVCTMERLQITYDTITVLR